MLTVYGSDGFTYDLRAALTGGRQGRRRRLLYGLGKPCKPKHGKVLPWPPVTVDGLLRHVKRFGPDAVEVTAKEAGVDEAGLLELGFGGATGDRVRALAAQGFVVAEIGRRLGVSSVTVRRHLG